MVRALVYVELALRISGFSVHVFNQPQIKNIKNKKKIPKSSKKQNLNLPHWQLFTHHLHYIYNYLHSIYIILGIISNLKMT